MPQGRRANTKVSSVGANLRDCYMQQASLHVVWYYPVSVYIRVEDAGGSELPGASPAS